MIEKEKVYVFCAPAAPRLIFPDQKEFLFNKFVFVAEIKSGIKTGEGVYVYECKGYETQDMNDH